MPATACLSSISRAAQRNRIKQYYYLTGNLESREEKKKLFSTIHRSILLLSGILTKRRKKKRKERKRKDRISHILSVRIKLSIVPLLLAKISKRSRFDFGTTLRIHRWIEIVLNNIIYLTIDLESIEEKLFGFDSCARELTNVSSSSWKDRISPLRIDSPFRCKIGEGKNVIGIF